MDAWIAALGRVRSVCLALPGVYEEPAWVGTRWKVRANTFAHLVEIVDGHPASFAASAGTDGPAIVLTLRCPWDDLAAVLDQRGAFGPLWGRNDVGFRLAEFDDRGELAELLVESYRLRAPKGLVRRLDDQVLPQRDSAKP